MSSSINFRAPDNDANVARCRSTSLRLVVNDPSGRIPVGSRRQVACPADLSGSSVLLGGAERTLNQLFSKAMKHGR